MASKWSGILSVVGKLAPTIASAVGGPLAGSAVGALEGALGVKTSGDLTTRQETVATALAGATQDQLLAVKQADQAFQEKMAQLGFDSAKDLETLTQADKASARSMHVANRESTPSVLSYAITVGFFGLLSLLAFHAVPESAKTLLDTMIGALGTAWIACVQFWFGSSSGEAQKTELLAQSTPPEKK